jgi:Tfp pilus assembly protein PilO
MKSTIPIILILASFGLFFLFTNKQYEANKLLKLDVARYDQALGKSNEVLKKRGELQEKYKNFSQSDLASLKKLLPDHIDNIQLILDINSIAQDPKRNMRISKIKISEDQVQEKNAPIGPSTSPFSSILVSFRTTATYDQFKDFMQELERSLRLVDVTNLTFKSDPKGLNEYAVTIRTYWLK